MSNSKVLSFFILSGMILLVFIFKRNEINLDIKEIGDFANIFTSIILEAIPFIILGSFISAIIQIFISEEFIAKLIPQMTIFVYLGLLTLCH